MDLSEVLETLRRRWLTVVLICLGTVGATALAMIVLTPQYTATTQLFFGVQGGETVADLAQGSTFTEQQMKSYVTVATSPLVLDRVIEKNSLNTTARDLAENVVAESPEDTVILEVSATDTDPQQAARIANSIGAELKAVAGDLVLKTPDGSQGVRATTLAQAIPPNEPSSPQVARSLAAALALGLLLGVGVALLRNILDTKVRSQQDLQTLTEVPVLGILPLDLETPPGRALHNDALGLHAEAVRRLRTNIRYVEMGTDKNSLVITSAIAAEGKTVVALGLALSLADSGLRVILVDGDLRGPSIGASLGLDSSTGLTTVLTGNARLDEAVQTVQSAGLDVLTAGGATHNPSELLGSTAMSSLMQQLSRRYDMVLLDSPPLLAVTDAVVLGKTAGGTLLVVGMDRIRRAQLRDALDWLTTAKCELVGLVLNKVAPRDTNMYVYHDEGNPQWLSPSSSPKTAPEAPVH